MPILRISRRPKERNLSFFPLFPIVFYILDSEHCQGIALLSLSYKGADSLNHLFDNRSRLVLSCRQNCALYPSSFLQFLFYLDLREGLDDITHLDVVEVHQ